MRLQRQHAGFCGLGGNFVGHVHSQFTVDVMLQVIPLGNNNVVVPILVLDGSLDFIGITHGADDFNFGFVPLGLDDGFLAALRENAPPLLFVENTAVGLAGFKVRLI